MPTQQPVWQFLANLGDLTPLDYGGYFVFRDTTGVYPEEAEYLEVPDEGASHWTVYRVVLDRCQALLDEETRILYLVPSSYEESWSHPLQSYDEWFHKDLASVASSCGSTAAALRDGFCSADPIARAQAYRSVAEYHGWDNFNAYPLHLTAEEVQVRYQDLLG
jgi:hypothetical protein